MAPKPPAPLLPSIANYYSYQTSPHHTDIDSNPPNRPAHVGGIAGGSSASLYGDPFFFYGPLMDPSTLISVLKLRDRPVLLPAKIRGYEIMLWGNRPALVEAGYEVGNGGLDVEMGRADGEGYGAKVGKKGDGSKGAVVDGMAFGVRSLTERERLEAYQADEYKIVECVIELDGGMVVNGKTFVWNGNRKSLKEGSWSMRDWIMDQLDT
jgi:hypothetical protein